MDDLNALVTLNGSRFADRDFCLQRDVVDKITVLGVVGTDVVNGGFYIDTSQEKRLEYEKLMEKELDKVVYKERTFNSDIYFHKIDIDNDNEKKSCKDDK